MIRKMIRKKVKPHSVDTLIGEGTVIEGKVIAKASIRIEGHVKGDIECAGDITIGAGGMTHSNLHARCVIVAGVTHGNIAAKEMLCITRTGKVYGSINVPVLTVAEGGTLQGVSRMESKPSLNVQQSGADEHAPAKPDKIAAVK